jgi:hypothetical protein
MHKEQTDRQTFFFIYIDKYARIVLFKSHVPDAVIFIRS